MKKRGWHNPSKFIKKGIGGYCKLCHKKTKSLEKHNKTKHKKAKL